MKEPDRTVSVVIRTCNRPGAVTRAIHSVMSQTWPRLEIIVVNDGTCELDLPESPSIPLRVVAPPSPFNRSRAGNTGWQAARGNLVAFLDDDDIWLPRHLETLVLALHRSPWCSVAYSSGLVADPSGRQTPLPSRRFDPRDLFRENQFPIHAALVRRSALAAVNGFDEHLELFEDWDLWLSLWQQRFSFLPVRAWTAIYRQHPQGTLSQIPFGSSRDSAARLTVLARHDAAIGEYLRTTGRRGWIRAGIRRVLFKVITRLLT